MDETQPPSDQQPQEQQPKPEERKPQPASEVRRQYTIWAVIVFIVLLWFIRDGWYNQDPKMLEHQSFNRVGSIFVAAAFLYCVYTAVKFHLIAKREQSSSQGSPPGETKQ